MINDNDDDNNINNNNNSNNNNDSNNNNKYMWVNIKMKPYCLKYRKKYWKHNSKSFKNK